MRIVGHIGYRDELEQSGKALCGKTGRKPEATMGLVTCSKCCAAMREIANDSSRRLARIRSEASA